VRRAAKLFLGVAVGILACLSTAHAEPPQQRPFIGYLCGAGGQRGTTVQLTVGGQNLRGAKQVVVSGTGVRGKVLRHGRTPWLLQNEQRRLLGQMLRRLAVQKITGKAPRGKLKNVDDQGKPVVLPDHPLLRDLESMTLEELRRVAYEYLDPARRSQISAQIVETALIEVVLDPDAAPGERELRLVTPLGLTNPVLFQVGLLPESKEQEPNDYRTARQPTTTLPRVLNGQVSFKDIDRFRFRARAGQKLVIEAQARRLVPYLADAVPGWFQATLAIYDDRGQEIRYVDDFRFDPDPVCLFEVPRTGEYVLEIRDAIHRGREDFVYRITIAERPYVTSLYPLGGKAGAAVTAEVGGWNLPWDHVILDTTPGSRTRASSWSAGGMLTNPVTYAVDDLPDSLEKEPNDGPREAQPIDCPRIVNGRIGTVGDVDVFRFEGRAGEKVVAEIRARRVGSPLDSTLQLLDARGEVVAWNDDHADRSAGLVTHQGDSYLLATLPRDGVYLVRVADAQGQGGPAFAYRLRVGPPQPDFTVLVTPSSINVPASGMVAVVAHAVRRDGFEGPITLSFRDPPPGFEMSGARIPAGKDRIRLTVAGPRTRSTRPVPLTVLAHAEIDGRRVTRKAIPAEDMMQAFGLRHLVASRELLAGVTRSWRRGPPLRVIDRGPIRIPAGGETVVRMAGANVPNLDRVEFQLWDAPKGVSIRGAKVDRGVLFLTVGATAEAEIGGEDNLVVEVYTHVAVPPRGNRNKGKKAPAEPAPKKTAKGTEEEKKEAPKTRRVYVGVLPAIPIAVVGGSG
jgi:hypothetical protein